MPEPSDGAFAQVATSLRGRNRSCECWAGELSSGSKSTGPLAESHHWRTVRFAFFVAGVALVHRPRLNTGARRALAPTCRSLSRQRPLPRYWRPDPMPPVPTGSHCPARSVVILEAAADRLLGSLGSARSTPGPPVAPVQPTFRGATRSRGPSHPVELTVREVRQRPLDPARRSVEPVQLTLLGRRRHFALSGFMAGRASNSNGMTRLARRQLS